jgi:hypothetical protein
MRARRERAVNEQRYNGVERLQTFTRRDDERHGAQTARSLALLFVSLAILLLLAACDTGQAGTTSTSPFDAGQTQYGGTYSGGNASGDTQAGADFARWVLDQDPNRKYITDAVVRNEQTLGVKVKPTATRAQVQALINAMAQGMARTFPGKDLNVIMFYQSGDKLAEGNYSAQTGQTNVQFYK